MEASAILIQVGSHSKLLPLSLHSHPHIHPASPTHVQVQSAVLGAETKTIV